MLGWHAGSAGSTSTCAGGPQLSTLGPRWFCLSCWHGAFRSSLTMLHREVLAAQEPVQGSGPVIFVPGRELLSGGKWPLKLWGAAAKSLRWQGPAEGLALAPLPAQPFFPGLGGHRAGTCPI